jgi:hypothetical protein
MTPFITLPSHYHHTIITLSSHYHHTIITLSSHYHHTIITLSSHYHHTIITLSPHYHHTIITLSSYYHYTPITLASSVIRGNSSTLKRYQQRPQSWAKNVRQYCRTSPCYSKRTPATPRTISWRGATWCKLLPVVVVLTHMCQHPCHSFTITICLHQNHSVTMLYHHTTLTPAPHYTHTSAILCSHQHHSRWVWAAG